MVEGLLYKRCYSVSDDEVQLRCCVPREGLGAMELPGYGKVKLNMRERLLLEYHNSPVGGHLGREKTIGRIEADYWWPGLATDVKQWCKRCVQCQKAKGVSKKTAWTRTEVFSRPFRVLQFDTIGPLRSKGDVTGAEYVLTVIDCFSRFSYFFNLFTTIIPTIYC